MVTFFVVLALLFAGYHTYGRLAESLFGPVVFLWIVFGSILGGAVRDYMTGMISCRMGGASVSEILGKYLGNFCF